VLYWLKQDVWNQVRNNAICFGGHLCIDCAGDFLGRKLTLHDLAIDKYKLTAKNMPDGDYVISHCVVGMLLGAAAYAGVEGYPAKWCWHFESYYRMGEQLAAQTNDAAQVLPDLFVEAERHFPNFRDPYDAFSP